MHKRPLLAGNRLFPWAINNHVWTLARYVTPVTVRHSQCQTLDPTAIHKSLITQVPAPGNRPHRIKLLILILTETVGTVITNIEIQGVKILIRVGKRSVKRQRVLPSVCHYRKYPITRTQEPLPDCYRVLINITWIIGNIVNVFPSSGIYPGKTLPCAPL